MSRNLRSPEAALAFILLLSPSGAQAQGRYPGPFPGPYGYRLAEPESNLRIDVTPREATVYVDGYLAGTVDEFDGVFQRLHVTPGEHALTIYLPGYRTIRQKLYLSPNVSRKITETMEKLGPGESTEPPPTPPEPPPDVARASVPPGDRNPYPFPGRGGQLPQRDPRQPEAPPPPRAPESSSAVGSIVLRVHPADADVMIDQEHWRSPSGNERLVVQVPEGRHQIEVRKDGYVPFSTNVEIRRNDSLPINVSLVKE